MNEHYIEALDIAYISSFSTKIKTSLWYLFLNENQPDYYDANHAHISRYLGNYDQIIDEVVSFYQSKNIIPRFYLSQYENNEDFITVLKQRGFGFEEFSNPVQLWNKKVEIEKIGNVTIEEVTLENKREAIDI